MVRLLKVISGYNLYLYWVSVDLRMRSFTVRFKTRIHQTSFMDIIMGIAQIRMSHKYAFHHPLINIIYVPLLWVRPDIALYTNMFLATLWVFDSCLTVGLFLCYRFVTYFYIHLSMVSMLDSDLVLREWRHFVLIRPAKSNYTKYKCNIK